MRTLLRRLAARHPVHVEAAAPTLRLQPREDENAALARLLGRAPVSLDTPELQRFLGGRRVLVTGAGGSIGSELCRQAARYCPAKLVLLERSEPALFEIERELTQRWAGISAEAELADVTDAARLQQLFARHRPHVVFHAAAHKHVPLMERHPAEAVRNNVFGTLAVAEAAKHAGTDAFVLVSTDKAVNPSSVMGASKRLAEMAVGDLFADAARTRAVAVRFGNVLGSSGSVVPTFRRQIEAGGPVTVTHPEMRRYFMTIPEATQLVIQAGAAGRGGEVLLLDMGEPVRIVDLARKLVEQAGLVAGRDIEIRVTGTRPGEKLFEELSSSAQRTRPTQHPKIRAWSLPAVDGGKLAGDLTRLRVAVETRDDEAALFGLRCAVPEFAPPSVVRLAA